MHYKPLLLALLLSFSVSPVLAKDHAKEKNTASVKSVKDKKDNKKETDKAASSKNAAQEKNGRKTPAASKESDAKKPAAQKTESGKAANAAERKEKSEAQNKKKTGESNTPASKEPAKKRDAQTKDSKSTSKQPAKETAKDAAKQKNTPSAKHKADAVKTEEKAEKTNSSAKEKNKQPNKKNDVQESRNQNRKAEKNDTKNNKEDKTEKEKTNKKTDTKTSKKSDTDSGELKAAVAAATQDAENKKALLKQSEGLVIRVNASLKQLQQTRNSLSSINRKQKDAWEKFQKLNNDLGRLKTEIGNTRAQISRFVSGNYKNSQPNAVALFLKNAEPGQKTRFLRYTRYINDTNQKVIQGLEKQQKELAVQEQKINNELTHLKRIQTDIQNSLRRQGLNNSAEQTESRRQNAKIAKDAQKAAKQKEDEQRLNNLLNDLEKRKAEQRRQEAEARKKAAEARLAAAEKARKERLATQQKAAAERAAMSTLTEEDMKIKAPEAGVAAYSTNGFSRMQGRLKKPVNGTLTGLFGQMRIDNNIWKGVFYSTAPGTPVNSIFSGTVTYAGELDGYGNVAVIDHGEGYVSIYSGLASIDVAQGYAVNTGNTIGTSGTLPEVGEGLYLEIRYNSQNMNPLSWIN